MKQIKDKKFTYHQKKTANNRWFKIVLDIKIINLIDTTSDTVPRFTAKKWIEVHDQSANAENRYKPRKKIRFKTLILQSDLYDNSDTYIVVKGTINITHPINDVYGKKLASKKMYHSIAAFQKLIIISLIMLRP